MSTSMADVGLTLRELKKTKRLSSFVKASDPSILGVKGPNERTETRDGMAIHWNVPISTRDGVTLRANIFHPENQATQKLSFLLNYSVYSKDYALEACMFPASSRLDNTHYTPYYGFEACDAIWWTQSGYFVAFVDSCGSFQSEGDKSFYSRDVGVDGKLIKSLNKCFI
ncbi:hypothetical protein BJX65DRAFT_314962 [Aspergillus insuetus]